MKHQLFWLVLVLIFAVLFLQAASLQLIKGAQFRQNSEQNRVKITRVPAERGVIYDREGKVLVQNSPSGREYVLGEAASHLLGYLGEADEQEVKAFSVSLDSLVGKLGIERAMDGILRGVDGKIVEEVDASGEVLRKIAVYEPEKGSSVKLTIDKDLQKRVYELIEEKKGAVVVSQPDGKILALVSSPGFEPGAFVQSPVPSPQSPVSKEKILEAGNWKLEAGNSEKIQKIFSDPDQPMFNRAIGGLYPPGSTFKIITATAGLEVGVIDEDRKVEDTGEIKIGEYTYGNWYFTKYGKKEGMVDILKAIKRSNDIFFYKTGEWLGITKLSAWAKEFGLGKETGISLIGEEKGLVPDEQWKEDVKKENWYLGDSYITAIGQGDLQTTPLQVNQMTAVIANGGKLCGPSLVEEAIFPISGTVPAGKEEKCKRLPISEKTLELVREGMKQACEEGGTGWPLFKFKITNDKLQIDNENYFEDEEATRSAQKFIRIPVACKTGTAEASETEEPHAWFTVFAPVYDPEIVVTILLENAGEGSDEAAPVAKEILEYWFTQK